MSSYLVTSEETCRPTKGYIKVLTLETNLIVLLIIRNLQLITCNRLHLRHRFPGLHLHLSRSYSLSSSHKRFCSLEFEVDIQ